MVEAGNGDAADVVVVQSSVKRKEQSQYRIRDIFKIYIRFHPFHLFKSTPSPPLFSLHLSLWHPVGNITPHSTQMGRPRTSHTHIQSCMQIYTHVCTYMHDHKHTPTCSSREIQQHTQPGFLSNPEHQLQRENQVISINLIVLYHISTCPPL